MNSAVVAVVSAVGILCGYAVCQPVKYDQRQEGDLNVRTDVEDVVFVVVPPQDLVTTGMGLVAAAAADLLTKSYGGNGPGRWPLKTPSKVGFVPLEKSPYKVDLEKSGLKLKKISHSPDPNRFNIHDGKQPMKAETKTPPPTETPEKPVPETVTEIVEEPPPSATETKTVKKVLKPEEKVPQDSVKVVGDGSDPSSILAIEGCGPDARRDSSGKCVFQNVKPSPTAD